MKTHRTPKTKTVKDLPRYIAHDKANLNRSNPLPHHQAIEYAKRQSHDTGHMFYIDRVDGKLTKYNAVKCCFNGEVYDSIKEANYAQNLFIKWKAGIIKGFERQVPYIYIVTYSNTKGDAITTTAKYIADFVVRYPDGRTEVIDVKGVRTPTYKAKKKIIESLYKIKIIEI